MSRRPRQDRRCPARQRWFAQLALWIGLVCLIGEGSNALHMALVRHVRCAQHGDWTHADGHASAPHAPVVHPAPSAPEVTDVASDDAHTHDHCFVVSERGERTLRIDPWQLEIRPLSAAASSAQSHCAEHRAVEIYRFAPKTSPPV